MASIAMNCSQGSVRKTNQDACCLMVAQSRFGEIVMVVVCDGVGGLCRGELASTMVVDGFAHWFAEELPLLSDRMHRGFDPMIVQQSWDDLLADLNKAIREYGARQNALMGTTFTGLLLCETTYVVGHVGDCRAYVVQGDAIRQITEDQTLLARMRAEGVAEDDQSSQTHLQNVILQAVGTERVLKPAFYVGPGTTGDIYVLCSDGAYKLAGSDGIRSAFARLDPADERMLHEACDQVIAFDLLNGERDNLTIACASAVMPPRAPKGGEQQ